MNQQPPEETAEQAYRRGYADGYIQALNDVYRSRPIRQQLWDFWHNTLFDWVKRGDDGETTELPPRLG